MSEMAVKGPDRRYRWGRWSLSRYGWTYWEASDDARGSFGRTPWTALLSLLRWRRVPVRPS